MFLKSRTLRAIAAGALAAAVFGGCSGASQAPNSAAVPAPDFSLPGLNGQNVSLASFKGKIVLVDFWATWCGPCQETIPAIEALYRRYGAQGFTVVGVNVDGGTDGVADFVKHFGMTYPVLLDTTLGVGESYKVHGIPNMFLLDRSGRVRKHWVGEDDELGQTLDKEVQALLNEKS